MLKEICPYFLEKEKIYTYMCLKNKRKICSCKRKETNVPYGKGNRI